jgi:hypothetical protein
MVHDAQDLKRVISLTARQLYVAYLSDLLNEQELLKNALYLTKFHGLGFN